MERSDKMTPANYFRSTKIVHIAIVVGVVFYAAVTLIINTVGMGALLPEAGPLLMIAFPAISVVWLAGGVFVFRKKMKEILVKKYLSDRMNDYRGALVIQYAILEMPAFIAIVGFQLTDNNIYLAPAAVFLAFLIALAPTRKKLIRDLKLTREEAAQVMNPDSEII
ncbi:MAG: hypothetical protein JXR65_01615 [Bacteroidales bacterium]|nr:hypothetical protein [Bacteroidales bacterium]